MRIVLLHNAKAGDQEYTGATLRALVRTCGFTPSYYTIKEALRNPEVLQRGEFVAVAGGDGSVRKIALELVGTQQRLAPLPLGTANNISATLGISGSARDVVRGWRHGLNRKTDMGIAKGPWGSRWFLEGVGIGLVGRTISILNEVDRADPREFNSREDKLRRDLSVLVSLAHDVPPVPIEMVVDGRRSSGEFLILEILNIERAGPGLRMATCADPSDGFLDMVVAPASDRPRLLKNLHRCLGRPEHKPILSGRKVRHLKLTIRGGEFRIDDQVVVGRDDVASKKLQVDVDIVPAALNVLLPAG
jgi:diacylglycerol kinase (ATP)